MWESIAAFASSMFGDMFSGDGKESGNMMSGVKTALMIAGGHGKAHSNVQAAPYHFTTNANLDTTLNHEASYMKNDIDPSKGFNSLKGLF